MAEHDSFSWRRVARLFAPHRARVIVVSVLVLATAVLGVVNPLLIQVTFDDGLFPASGGVDVELVVTLCAIMLGITATSTVLGVVQTIATNRLGQDVLRELRDRLYRHLHDLSLSFYASSRTGDLQSRISNDVGGVQTAVTTTLSNILSNVITLASAIVAMLLLSVPLTLLSLATVPFFVWATRVVGRRREAFTAETQAATAEMSVVTQETLSVSGITLAKLFGRQDREIERFERANVQLAEVATKQQVIGQSFFTVVQAFLGASPIIVYLVAALLLDGSSNALTAGTIVAFTTLQSRLFFPVARLLETTVELQSSRALFRRIFDYLDAEVDVVEAEHPVELRREDVRGEVRFDEVVFDYDASDDDEHGVPALAGVDFEARPGQLVALVGPSGSGKSTILSLLARLYDPTTGAVRLDGVDLRELSFESLSSAIGFVTQESYLFAGTLRANIAYADSDATHEQVEKAARAAAIHERIVEFADGYDTVVGERGFRLSGGERQRIAIARVLLHDPPVLVLDEATSALDTASERRIQAALGELISGRTTIAVAHRLSTIRSADVIHVVERGRIVESGDHDELLAHGGSYAELYREQFGDGTIETTCADGTVYADGRCDHFRGGDEDRDRIFRQRRLVAGNPA
ncbi:MAG: ABC transporter ATP-binding protein [Ilumatobacter sp.]|nr:ABC transporter ATP-binding protein [Ilumatobacter sp.]